MAHQTRLFESIPIDLKKRSGFDMSHENLLTQQCGTITPILTEPLSPNETVSLGYFAQIEMAPLATNFYGRVDMCIEAFFVPYRLLWGGWKYFWTRPQPNPFNDGVYRPTAIPSVSFYFSEVSNLRNSIPLLLDYLGLKAPVTGLSSTSSWSFKLPNAFPLLGYARIYDDWYRNKNLMKPLFVNPNTYQSADTAEDLLMYSPWQTLITSTNTAPDAFTYNSGASDIDGSFYNDGTTIVQLRQRQWMKDYFTTAALYPQAAVTPSSVDASDGTFTIAQLRQANVLQRWYERNNLAGFDYQDQIFAQYGIRPADAGFDKPIFLSQSKFNIYSKSVMNTAGNTGVSNTKNPFSSYVGSKSGSGSGFGKDSLISSFTAKEHGLLMVLATVVPHSYYSTGTRRYLSMSTQADFPQPLLEGLGEQEIYQFELAGFNSSTASSIALSRDSSYIFGYQQQYSEFKYHDDEVHAYLVDGKDLQYFALQRSFNPSSTSLNSSFLEIPTNYLDQVLAVATSTSGYTCWCDYFFEFKKISTLSEYVIPTLGDMKNTYKARIPYRGSDIRG